MRPPHNPRRAILLGIGTLTLTALAGCTATGAASGDSDTATDTTASATDVSITTVPEAMDANVGYTTGETEESALSDPHDVALSGDTATTDSDTVTVADGTVTMTAAGVYRLTGDLDGQIVVDTEDSGAVTLVLDDVTITSSTTSAIAFMNADEAVVVLADGSTNTLTDAETYVYPDAETDEPNAALFSKTDLTIGGTGALTVTGSANDGIGSKDGLVITGGDITVSAVDDGIRGKDYLVIAGGTLNVSADDDGLKSDNDTDDGTGYILLDGGDVTVAAGDDAVKGEQQVLIAGGTLEVLESVEGIEAEVIIIDDGAVSVTSSDDGVNASAIDTSTDDSTDATDGQAEAGTAPEPGEMPAEGEMPEGFTPPEDGERPEPVERPADGEMSEGPGMPEGGGMGGMDAADETLRIVINGGTLAVDAEGDGLDSNGTLTVTGGTITIDGPTNSGNGALDTAGTLDVTGGTLVAVGSSGMAESPSADSAQAWLAASFDARAAGSTVAVTDADGAVILEYTAGKTFASLVYSEAAIGAGEQYTVTVDGVELATVTAGEAAAGGMGAGPGGGVPGGGGSPGDPGQDSTGTTDDSTTQG